MVRQCGQSRLRATQAAAESRQRSRLGFVSLHATAGAGIESRLKDCLSSFCQTNQPKQALRVSIISLDLLSQIGEETCIFRTLEKFGKWACLVFDTISGTVRVSVGEQNHQRAP